MKHLSEYRDADRAKQLIREITHVVRHPWAIMEVCGGQTHSLIRYGIDQVLPKEITLIHGPGCPVCVTSLQRIDQALTLASLSDVIFCSFGDMLRVPGSNGDLLQAKAAGGDVRVVYSPLDALRIADENPQRQVVFFAIGFETTAPATAMALKLAKARRVKNFSALVSHVLVPPAMEAIVSATDSRVDAFLAAGHVCCVTGLNAYPSLCQRYRVPIVVTGFEPLDLLDGIRRAVVQLERGEARVENAYSRAVPEQGNPNAIAALEDVFEVTDRAWRGMGMIARSGWRICDRYREFDAEARFDLNAASVCEPTLCRAGEVLRGTLKPNQCQAFGRQCTPERPLGAPMVSSEGACAAYYNHGRLATPTTDFKSET